MKDVHQRKSNAPMAHVKSTQVILNPISHKVIHFLLQDKSLPDNPTRLVPAGNVAGATQQQIKLN
jgi:hypothetical protein